MFGEDLAEALRHAPGAIVVHDTYGRCQWVGGELLEELGHKAEEWVGGQGHDLFHPDDEEAALANHERLLRKGHGQIVQRLRSRSGWAWVCIESRVVTDPKCVVSTVRLAEPPEGT